VKITLVQILARQKRNVTKSMNIWGHSS